jgi:dolichyl-phosphate-mannose--protein O-mannosyl transferase
MMTNLWDYLSNQKEAVQTIISIGGFSVFAIFVLIIIPFVIYPNIRRILQKKIKWKKGEGFELSDSRSSGDRRKK